MSISKSSENLKEKACKIIAKHGEVIRTSQALKAGIHPRTLYQLRDEGVLEQISRGIYRLAEAEPITNPDLITVATRVPQAVICLISALAFHQLTTQIPHTVSIALRKGAESPKLRFPPISIYRFGEKPFNSGIDDCSVDGIPVRIYCPEKTLADCFKFRNQIGMDIVLEALKTYKAKKKFDIGKLLKYAKVCRVEKVMRPYLEALL